MIGFIHSPTPWCGAPPVPGDMWQRWRLDPVVLALLGASLGLYLVFSRVHGVRRWAFVAGWGVAALSLVSPLCPLSVALFSARDAQHMLITLLAAPLVAAGLPRPIAPPKPLLATGVFAATLWLWHAPALYDATFSSDALYWLMHASLFASALWLWSGFVGRERAAPIANVGAAIASSAQMGLLGALLTFAPGPLYAPHLLAPYAFGLTPLADQQLGGAIMWAPGCGVFLALSLGGLAALLRDDGRGLDATAGRATP